MSNATYYSDGMDKYRVTNGYEHYTITDKEIERGKELLAQGAFVSVRVPCSAWFCKGYTSISLEQFLAGKTSARHNDTYHEMVSA